MASALGLTYPVSPSAVWFLLFVFFLGVLPGFQSGWPSLTNFFDGLFFFHSLCLQPVCLIFRFLGVGVLKATSVVVFLS